jgi:signal peptidase
MSTVTTDVTLVIRPPRPTPVGFLRLVLATALRMAFWLAFGFAVAISGSITIPAAFGYTSLDELSGSMTPSIRVGDELIEKRIAPLDAQIGDIVTFRSPDNGRILTHRVTSMQVMGKRVVFTTRGDANTGFERWSIAQNGKLGKVYTRIPLVGYVTNRAGSRLGRIALLVLPVLLLSLLELRRIWRS